MEISVSPRTWRYPLAARILMMLLAAGITALGLFLFCLPFALGAGADPVVFVILGLCGTFTLALGVFLGFGASAAMRTHVTVGGASLEAAVPAERGWVPIPHFRTVNVPLSSIRAVERRNEIVRTMGMSTARESLSIVTADDERVGLFTNADTALVRLPTTEIANAIAAAAGVAVADRGTVMSTAIGLFGAASSTWTETPLDPVRAAKAKRAAALTLQIIVGLVLLTFVIRACTGS